MNRIEYYNTVYDKFWKRQTHRYGCAGYEEIIINNIVNKKYGTILVYNGRQIKEYIK